MKPSNPNLLDDAVFTMSSGRGVERLCLPEAMSRLSTGDEELRFGRLMPHQEHIWHVFVVQLAALVAHREGLNANELLAKDTSFWTRALRDLAGGDEAWTLFVEDLSKPAFMQPPVPEGNLNGFKGSCNSPSDLDTIIMSKNHELKLRRMGDGDAELWIYALAVLQTSQGFIGAGNYGIARMNGGFGSRVVVGWSPSPHPGPRFRRDVAVVLEARNWCIEQLPFAVEGGHTLLWTQPWDGVESLAISACDPWCIEVCRRLRFDSEGRLRRSASKAARIDAKSTLGVFGDPWTPIVVEKRAKDTEEKSLTLSAAGFNYERLAQLIRGGEGIRGSAVATPRPQDGSTPWFLAAGLTRGQGKTERFSVRQLRVPTRAMRSFFSGPSASALRGLRIDAQLEDVRNARLKILKPALCTLLQGAPDEGGKLNLKDERPKALLERLDGWIDDNFFPVLWQTAEEDAQQHRERWQTELVQQCKAILSDASVSYPVPLNRQSRTIALAEHRLMASARKHFESYRSAQDRRRESTDQQQTGASAPTSP